MPTLACKCVLLHWNRLGGRDHIQVSLVMINNTEFKEEGESRGRGRKKKQKIRDEERDASSQMREFKYRKSNLILLSL